MFRSRKTPTVYLGIDIGVSYVKGVLIEKDGNQNRVRRLFRFNSDQLNTLRDYYPEGDCQVAVSIPSNNIDIRSLILPRLPEKEFRDMIGYEIAKEIGMDENDLYYDYTYSNEHHSVHSSKKKIIVFSCRRADMEEFLTRYDYPKTKIDVVDVDWMGLLNLYSEVIPDFSSKTYIGIDAGESGLKLLLLRNGVLSFCRHYPLVATPGIPELAGENDMVNDIATEIQRTFHYCKSQFQISVQDISAILVSGGKAAAPLFLDHLKARTNFNCQSINITNTNRFIFGDQSITEADSLSYAVAFGMAIRLIRDGI